VSNSPVNQTLMIVGGEGGTHIGGSLHRAAVALGWNVEFRDSRLAYGNWNWFQRFSWHFAGRRPTRLGTFNHAIDAAARHVRPRVLISTGLAPLTARTLVKLRARGVRCLNYSTDDPWNPGQRATWFLKTLPLYDHIFSARRSNMEDFRKVGANVSYLPFGYDPELFFPTPVAVNQTVPFDLLFVGGADDDRASMLNEIARSGLRVALYGDYWDRYESLRQYYHGRADVPLLRKLTGRAAVNLCLCRRSNRDGHVMRSLEIAAIGGFMLAEETQEHRELFGEEGECVLYFGTEREAIEKARWAMEHPSEQRRMAAASHNRIVGGRNTYRHRLQKMLCGLVENRKNTSVVGNIKCSG
jgi:spore maturation protein CgeB